MPDTHDVVLTWARWKYEGYLQVTPVRYNWLVSIASQLCMANQLSLLSLGN
jgi:hypothetical protein